MSDLNKVLVEYKNKIDKQLLAPLEKIELVDLREAMEYSLKNGGKRIRPALLLATYEVFCADEMFCANPLIFANALEYIHTYSLIHDDLPAMDDDDYRRGKLTNHKVFGEATAILAGDGLLNTAFELMGEEIENVSLKNINSKNIDAESILVLKSSIEAMNVIVKASGSNGMIQGQVLDMKYEKKDFKNDVNLEVLQKIHKHKTGALIKSSILSGFLLSNNKESEYLKDDIIKLSEYLGIAFQIQDDILDCTSTFEKLGKPINSDIKNDKATYVSLLGFKGAKEVYNEYKEKIISIINKLELNNTNLEKIILEILIRDN